MSTNELGGFRIRGKEVTRLEAFSDTVFGFALTLLVVSLDVPRTFRDLTRRCAAFPRSPFAFSFSRSSGTAITNFAGVTAGRWVLPFPDLLDVICRAFLRLSPEVSFHHEHHQHCFLTSDSALCRRTDQIAVLGLDAIYGLGFAAVYLALTLLYLHAWKLRDQLELTDFELIETRYQIERLIVLVAFGSRCLMWADPGDRALERFDLCLHLARHAEFCVLFESGG